MERKKERMMERKKERVMKRTKEGVMKKPESWGGVKCGRRRREDKRVMCLPSMVLAVPSFLSGCSLSCDIERMG